MLRKYNWLVYVDSSPDDPIRVLAVTAEQAKEEVNQMCIDEGHGELDVGAIGWIKTVKEERGTEYWKPTRYREAGVPRHARKVGPETFKELLDFVGRFISTKASIGETDDGELVIWTNLEEDEDGGLIEFVEPDDKETK